KTYLAICDGEPKWDACAVDAPLGDHPLIYGIGAVVELRDGGKPARTEFRVLQRGEWRGNPWALLEARPRTGRAHQIRLHLQSLGLPLIGDGDYNLCPRIRFPRQALHAAALAFAHPFTGAALEIRAPLPEDMRRFVAENAAPGGGRAGPGCAAMA
ncbi:MAG: RluA family pseudouridine synthase, partial [Planctomycetes bacterium]|nr:RluA family pseudouridine synthase [Planctomycetota bacterium]